MLLLSVTHTSKSTGFTLRKLKANPIKTSWPIAICDTNNIKNSEQCYSECKSEHMLPPTVKINANFFFNSF